MTFTKQERALVAYALGVYRVAASRGELPAPAGGVEELDAITAKLERDTAADVVDGEYHGIGERRGDCLCGTCRKIIEGQLRELLGRVPADKRSDMFDRVESSITDGTPP